MKTSYLISAAAILAGVPGLARADEAAELDTLVVTATRAPERLDRIGGQVTVIDEEEIAARQSPVVSDLLLRTPGVSLARNGGIGAATQLRIRGAETDQTVVLIDGVKLNDPSGTGGGYNFANLLTGDVARIEVLRGAQSVLWGSQAIGGVVNIITRQPQAPFEADVQGEAGAQRTAYGRLGLGGAGERLSWRLSGGYFTTDGISVFNAARGGREPDGYKNLGLTGKVRLALTDALSLDLRSVYSRGRADQDGFLATGFGDTPDYGRTEELVAYAGANLETPDGRFSHRAAFAYTDTDRRSFNPLQAVTPRTFEAGGQNRRFEYQGTWRMRDGWTAVFGAESERSRMRTASPTAADPNPIPGRRRARLDGVYGQLSAEVAEGLTLAGGLRYDDHGDFGGHAIGQASAAWRLAEATVLRASVAQGFKAPTLFQLGSEFGNAGLEPEAAETWDAGVQHAFGPLRVQAAYFHRKTVNQIDFVSCFTTVTALCFANGRQRTGYYDNVFQAKAQGVELQAELRATEALAFSGNYTWTEALNDAAGTANFGKRLARRPEHQANAEAAYDWPAGLTTSVSLRYAGASYDDAAGRNRLKSYVLWDLRADYPLTERIEVYGRVENLFDAPYETIRNYGQPGRAAYAGVRARF